MAGLCCENNKATCTRRENTQAICFTLFVQQHHDAVTVGVAIEMSGNDVTVLPADGDQPLVVALSHSSDVSDKGQVPHRHMSDDVHLEREVSHISGLHSDKLINMQHCEEGQRSAGLKKKNIPDLLQALSCFLQGFLQPLELSSRVCHVTGDFIRTVVEDSVETHHPQTRLYQLGVETACRHRTKHKMKPYSMLREGRLHNFQLGQYYNTKTKHYILNTENVHISTLTG